MQDDSTSPPGGEDDSGAPFAAAHERTKELQMEAIVQDMERRYIEICEEKDALQQQLQVTQGKLQQALEQTQKLQEQGVLEKQAALANEKLKATEQQVQTLQERLDRNQIEADQLREEISRLSKSNSEMSKALADIQVQQTVKESQAIPLAHEKQRLLTELSSLQAHADWLEAELDAKTKDYQHLQQESRDKALQLQLQLDHTTAGKDAASVRLEALEQVEQELQVKVQQLSQDLLHSKQEMVNIQETSQQAVLAEQKLNKVQQEHLDRWQQRYNTVVAENESLKKAASKAMEAHEKELQELEQKLQTKYQGLLQEQQATHEQALQQQSQSTAAAAAAAAPVLLPASTQQQRDADEQAEEPLNMTDLYTRWEQTKLALQQEQIQRQHWQLQFQKVQADIVNMRPQMRRQAREYDMAVSQVQDYQERLELAREERDHALHEVREARQQAETSKQQVENLKIETEELAKQVQALLSRRSGRSGEYDDIPITIQEVQSQNQRLLVEHRRLEKQVQDLQTQLDADELRSKLESAQSDLKALQQQRQEQEKLVDQIVLQRDLYKSLLATKDQNMITNENEESSALDMLRQHSERSKQLQERNKELEGELAAARSEADRLVREKETAEERLSRFEAHASELSQSMDVLQRDLLTAKSETARTISDAEYHKEKCERLEASLERARGENMHLSSAKNEMQRINTELQHSISSANANLSRLEGEKRQVEGNLRLIKTQLETVKASESRAMQENGQLRQELAQQGALIDSVRRIEAGLQAKSESEKEALKEEVERLSKINEAETTKHSREVENFNARIEEYEVRIQDLSSSKDKAQADALASKKSLLETKTELQNVSSKCSLLESQLRAAKKRLGESDDVEGPEVTLQSRIDDLTSKLEAANAETVSLKERAANYQKLSQDSEKALSDLRSAMDSLKAEREQEMSALQEQLEIVKKQNSAKQELIQEMTNDLAGERGEREKLQAKLQAEIASLQTHIKNNEKDVESAKASHVAMKLEVESLKNEAALAQNNYEHELGLHSQARSALREAREKADEESRLRTAAEEANENLKRELEQERALWDEAKAAMQQSHEFLEKRLAELREQNEVLHKQLETLGNMAEEQQASRAAAAGEGPEQGDESSELHKIITELREVVRFLRSENEMIQTQLDTAKRTTERERASANVYKRSLDEARAELKVLQADENKGGATELSDLAAKLRSSEEQVKVLGDSNKLLREEADKLQAQVSALRSDLEQAQASAKPADVVKQEFTAKIAALEAEKDSLKRELESWKDRVKSLVSKFNQIDPAEHQQLKTKVEQMTKERESLNAWKKATEEENTRIRNIAKNLNQKARDQKTLIEQQQSELDKMSSEKEQLLSTAAADSQAAKERDTLKEEIAKMKKDADSVRTELEGANQRNDRLRERLRQFQTTIRELKAANLASAAIKASTSEAKQAESQPKATEKTTPSSTVPEKRDDSAGPATATLPTVPTGGFRFGPSTKEDVSPKDEKPSQSTASTQATEASKSPSILRASAPAFVPKKGETALKSLSTETAGTQLTSSEKPAESSLKRKSPPPPESTTETPSEDTSNTVAARRLSGEKKELSLKEKLMEKKRILAELKAKKQKEEAATLERAAKRAKVESSSESTEAASKQAEPEAIAGSQTGAAEVEMPSEKGAPPATDTSKGESAEAAASATGVTSKEVASEAGEGTKKAEIAKKSITEPRDKGDSPAVKAKKESEKPSTINPFAASTLMKPTIFGQSSSIATESAIPSVFGSSSDQSSARTFGAPASGEAGSSPFGGAFLNIKPPGSSSAPPTFSFGTSSSIKLPTPATQAPVPSPFGAFAGSSSGSFGGGGSAAGTPVTSKPLFGGLTSAPQAPSLEATESAAEKEEEEHPVEDEKTG